MKTTCLVLCATFCLIPFTARAELASLHVTVNGLEPTTGTVEVSLFNSEASFLKTPDLQQSGQVNGQESMSFSFAGLVEGDYAVVVVHDENDNGLLDTGFLGFGGESYGFSNDAVGWFGQPSFDQASFTVGKENLDIVINLD